MIDQFPACKRTIHEDRSERGRLTKPDTGSP